MVRVLIAEDSPTARALLVAILSSDPDVQVVGEARDGAEAVTMTKQLRPHVVTMDIQMPGVDGFEATRQIMIEAPTPIVVVTATIDNHGVTTSMQALRAGALTVLPKPVGPTARDFEEASRHFVSMVKAMAQVKVVRRWAPGTHVAADRTDAARIVAISASTGGPAALHRILTDLPDDFSVPILVVQHISPGFVAGLAAWLNTASFLRVTVAEAGGRLEPRTVYLAPDDGHLALSDRSTITVSGADAVRGFRPSGTVLFESVARACGSACLAVVLTGMGDDGVEGLRAIRRAGGHVLAQDEESCVVYGMPGAAVAAGLTHATVTLSAMASQISRCVGSSQREARRIG